MNALCVCTLKIFTHQFPLHIHPYRKIDQKWIGNKLAPSHSLIAPHPIPPRQHKRIPPGVAHRPTKHRTTGVCGTAGGAPLWSGGSHTTQPTAMWYRRHIPMHQYMESYVYVHKMFYFDAIDFEMWLAIIIIQLWGIEWCLVIAL